MNELALFAGAGGGLLATKWLLGWRTVCYVENASYPVAVIQARIWDGCLDDAPIWSDVRTFDGRPWRGCVDIVTAGFPCQPFSCAGKGLAERDERNLWPDTIRIIREVAPQWVLLENVSRLLAHAYTRRIFADLAEGGYDARWDCIPASAVGANHQRDRLWIVAHAGGRAVRQQYDNATSRGDGEIADNELAHADRVGLCEQAQFDGQAGGGYAGRRGDQMAHADQSRFQEHAQLDGETQPDPTIGNPRGGHAGGCGDQMADPNCPGLTQPGAIRGATQQPSIESCGDWWRWWQIEPDVGRVDHGVAARVDRLAAIGEGQVPAVVAVAWGLLGGGGLTDDRKGTDGRKEMD